MLVAAAGCTSPPAAPPPAAGNKPAPDSPARPLPATKPSLGESARFESLQREAARQAMLQRRWADASWTWDVVLALRPDDAEALEQKRMAVMATNSAVAELLPEAQKAQAKGDWETATSRYLDVLALDASQLQAAEALREIERQRTRRGVVTGSFSAYAMPPARPKSAATTSGHASLASSKTEAAPETAAQPPRHTQALERASALAQRNEWDAAIALLAPLATIQPPQAAARKKLAEIYFLKAQAIEPTDRAGAIQAWSNGLKLAPSNRTAETRLKLLKAPR